MRRGSTHPGRRRGFTLIEAISTIVILAAVALVASNIILTAGEGYLDAATLGQLHTEASIGLDRIARELRDVALDHSAGDVAPDIESLAPTSITWDDDDGLSLDGTNLMLVEDGGAPAVLISDVTSLSIAAYDEGNAALGATLSGAACDDIRRIAVGITQQRNGVSHTLRTKVFLRCTMSGAEAGG